MSPSEVEANRAYRARKKEAYPEAYKLERNAELKRYRDRQRLTEDGRLNSKVYLIRNSATPDTYVGSTTGRLAKRLADHKSFKRRGLGSALAAKIGEVGEEHWSIELLENFPAATQAELTAKEREWVAQLAPSLNIYTPSHPQREYKAEKVGRLDDLRMWRHDFVRARGPAQAIEAAPKLAEGK